MTRTYQLRRMILLIWCLDLAVVVAGSLLPGFLLARAHLERALLSDKAFHFLGYAVLGVLLSVAALTRRRAILGVFLMALMGLSLEFAQTLIPGRSFDFNDFHANNLGLGIGAAAGLAARRLAVKYLFRPESVPSTGKPLERRMILM